MGKSIRLERKLWESDFFQMEIGALHFDEVVKELRMDELNHLLSKSKFQLIECNLSSSNFEQILFVQKNKFVLVDSRIQFMSKVTSKEFSMQYHKGEPAAIRSAKETDQLAILQIVKECFVDYSEFVSRYKNEDFFPQFSAKKYFEAWVKKSFSDSESKISVSTERGLITGFSILKKIGQKEGLNVYKGVLSAVRKEYRGNSLLLQIQNYLLSKSNESELYYDSTSQLSNYAAINSYIKAGRQMNKISFTFYRKMR